MSYNLASRGEMSGVFKNSLVVFMYMAPGECSNFKISRLAKIQITGVKTSKQYIMPVLHLLKHVAAVFGAPSVVDTNELLAPLTNLSTVVRIPAQPAGADFQGWQCWAVTVMSNSYITLPHAADLRRLRDFAIQNTKYGFAATYEPGVNQSLAIKAKSRLTTQEQLDARHPYFTILDENLIQPNITTLTTSSLHDLQQIEQLAMTLTGTKPVSTSSNRPKEHRGTLLTYETQRTFMSAPGLEVERLYHDFCTMMTAYYATSSDEEKKGNGKHSRRRVVKPALPKPLQGALPVAANNSQTETDAMVAKMQAMRLKVQNQRSSVG